MGGKPDYDAIRTATTKDLHEVLELDEKYQNHCKSRTIFHYAMDNDLLWLWIVLCGALIWEGGKLALYGILAIVIGILIHAERIKRSELESLGDKRRAIESELLERGKGTNRQYPYILEQK
jgi:hypothetical protein